MQILNDPTRNHEYLGIEGLATFTEAAVRLLLGDDSQVISEKRVSFHISESFTIFRLLLLRKNLLMM